MAITQSSVPKELYKSLGKRSHFIAGAWLLMALLSAAAAVAIWMFTSSPVLDDALQQELSKPELAAFNIAQVTHIDKLDELSADVHPISFDALVRDLRDYPPEFKDAMYLKKNKGEWTLQVMDVSEHSVITDYLSSRKDRSKFAYFRYRDANNDPRYLLTYDVLKNEQSAAKEAGRVDFALPNNVQIIPEKIDSYLDVIEDYELSAPIKDLSRNRARQVKLQPTKRELAARRRANQAQQQRREESVKQKPETNVAAESSAPAAASNIQASPDSRETLAVQEERKVVVQDNERQSGDEGATQSHNQGSSGQEQHNEKPKAEAPAAKPQEKPKTNDNKQSSQKPARSGAATSTEVDPIKQLIDEKTQ